jgi:hypothetical protein
MMNEYRFQEVLVGQTGISYKWDIPITSKQHLYLKSHLPEYFQNGCSFTFVKDYFKEQYSLSVICYFEITPFNSKEHAEKYMIDDNIYLLYSKHPLLVELNDLRYNMINAGVGE